MHGCFSSRYINEERCIRGWPHTFLGAQNRLMPQWIFFKQECKVVIARAPEKNILFHLEKTLLDCRMFGKDDDFPDITETPPLRDFRAMYYDYRLGRSLQQSSQSLSNCFGDQSPPWSTVHKWYKQFQVWQNYLWRLTVVAVLWPLLQIKTWPKWSVWLTN